MKTYRTRYSLFLVVILAGCSFILIWKTIQELPGAGARQILWIFFTLLVYCVLMVGCLWTTYTIDEENKQLFIWNMFGLGKKRIEIMNISKIKRSRSLLSAPACSLNRIQINYIGRFQLKCRLLISPTNQEEFIAELLKINPDIQDLTKRV